MVPKINEASAYRNGVPMAAAPPTTTLVPFDRESRAYHQRWFILGVLCLSLLVIIVDNSILNVALPTLLKPTSQGGLGASNSQAQWMVDSYTLVFAGLLLTAGSLGDRYGRRGALQVGLLVFGFGSLASAFAGSANHLIFTRAVMGIGGAFIMPATLSIITNVFPPEERGQAIALWAAIAGIGVALGPISGGFLLQHFYWGSIFLVNVPIVAFALITGFFLIPTSRDPSKPKQDPIGASLSIVGLVSLVYAIIQGPERGWTDPVILTMFVVSAVVLAFFAWWEMRSDHPMLDVNFFRNPRFTAASTGITLLFFAMFGTIFVLTQYLQVVMAYTPFQAGVRLLPWAGTMLVVAPLSARLVERVGTKIVVGTGLATAALGLVFIAGTPGEGASYPRDVVWRLVVLAIGMGLTMAPATESIMGSLPRAKAGVGSAMNDTTRQVGGALGVAIVGSVVSSVYLSRVNELIAGRPLPASAVAQIRDSVGGAVGVASKLHAPLLASGAKDAFMAGMHRGVLVAAAAALIGSIVAWLWLPARGTEPEQVVAAADEVEQAPGAAAPQPQPQPAYATETS
jgi:EmrB/QacA subfamily drug resistance transporter